MQLRKTESGQERRAGSAARPCLAWQEMKQRLVLERERTAGERSTNITACSNTYDLDWPAGTLDTHLLARAVVKMVVLPTLRQQLPPQH